MANFLLDNFLLSIMLSIWLLFMALIAEILNANISIGGIVANHQICLLNKKPIIIKSPASVAYFDLTAINQLPVNSINEYQIASYFSFKA